MYFASLPSIFEGLLQIILSYRLEIFVVSSCLNCHDICLTLETILVVYSLTECTSLSLKTLSSRISRIPDKVAPCVTTSAHKLVWKQYPPACLVWVPDIEKIPSFLWNHITEKRGERVRKVPKGLFSCFYDLLGSSNAACIEWYVNQSYSFPFYYIFSAYTILIKNSCISVNKPVFPVRVSLHGHTINPLEAVRLYHALT